MKIEVKPLELKQEGTWLNRTFRSRHFRKSVIYIVIGAVAGFGYYYFTQGQNLDSMSSGDILRSALVGGFFGFFITNSPCARGRC